ncbi:hypothetical protein SAMN02787144_1004113 [Streptomyces atratus]|uniref:Uncharacterized protein n=1 Tax=Streptomyces atratus TaxID=1893 RepID=A0A1K1Y5P9_STRAR|nr:hypothetical protein SAMN02787144_1004113 [Streptomyces atratus]
MEFVALMTLPGLVIGLTAVAFLDQLMLRAGRAGLLPWRNGARQGQVVATGSSSCTLASRRGSRANSRSARAPC